jgi:hypothetical protein
MRGETGAASAQAGEIIVGLGLERHGEAHRARKPGEGVSREMTGGGGGASSAWRATFRVRAMPSADSSRGIERRSSARAMRGCGASCTVQGSGGCVTIRDG